MNIYADLFLTFAKVGVCTFGGGYAMLPILQREVVDSKHWATDDELNDYFAIGQCTPGIIAVNTSTFVGAKQRGILGGILATLGVVSPGLVIISTIAACLSHFQDVPAVTHAFNGIRACVCILILNAVIKLAKSSLVDLPSLLLFITVFLISAFFGLSPALLVLLAGIFGYTLKRLRTHNFKSHDSNTDAKLQNNVKLQNNSSNEELQNNILKTTNDASSSASSRDSDEICKS